MAEEKKVSTLMENLSSMATPENIQKYILGSNKSGQPRALYDIVKDVVRGKYGKKKKKKKGGSGKSGLDIFVSTKRKKKDKKKKKHWHI